jgi:hypothetical protein
MNIFAGIPLLARFWLAGEASACPGKIVAERHA